VARKGATVGAATFGLPSTTPNRITYLYALGLEQIRIDAQRARCKSQFARGALVVSNKEEFHDG
jgi:hypothetical protein